MCARIKAKHPDILDRLPNGSIATKSPIRTGAGAIRLLGVRQGGGSMGHEKEGQGRGSGTATQSGRDVVMKFRGCQSSGMTVNSSERTMSARSHAVCTMPNRRRASAHLSANSSLTSHASRRASLRTAASACLLAACNRARAAACAAALCSGVTCCTSLKAGFTSSMLATMAMMAIRALNLMSRYPKPRPLRLTHYARAQRHHPQPRASPGPCSSITASGRLAVEPFVTAIADQPAKEPRQTRPGSCVPPCVERLAYGHCGAAGG